MDSPCVAARARLVRHVPFGRRDGAAHSCLRRLAVACGLGATAGAVDIIGFLSLGGLFTAHIHRKPRGIADAFRHGTFQRDGAAVRGFRFRLRAGGDATLTFGTGRDVRASRRALLGLQAVLLGSLFAAGVTFGPFANPERAAAVCTGMLGVAAMATQSALVRLALPGAPATNVFTTNTTLLAIDLATLACGRGESTERVQARRRSGALPCIARSCSDAPPGPPSKSVGAYGRSRYRYLLPCWPFPASGESQ